MLGSTAGEVVASKNPKFAAGKLHYRETVAEGLASAPEAFIGLLQGKNLGKQLVKMV
jgi:NADPH-dependent curcumin reductase CurA